MKVEGYMQEIDSYLDVFPSVTQGCYWAVIVRPAIKANKDCLYILENGDIDAGTKGITWNLNLSPTKFNVKDISEELIRVNEAFNMIAFPERYNQPEEIREGKFRLRRSIDKGRVTMEQAKEIYALYTTTGKDLILSPVHEEKQQFSYNCKITNINFGTFLLKMATLEKNKTMIPQNKISEQEIIQLTSLQRIPLPKKLDEQIESSSSAASSTDLSELFETEEEKAAGWIDFKAINSQNFTPRTENLYSTADNCHRETTRQLLDTIATPREQHPLPKLIFTKEAPALQRKNPIVVIPEDELSNSTNDINTGDFHKNLNDQNLFGEEVKSQISTVNGSKHSQQKRISHVYLNALDEIYHTRSTKILLFLSLLLLIFLSIGQIGLKTRMDSDMLALRNKKDLVGGAELQNCQAISVQAVLRIIWDLRTGFMNSTTFSNYQASFPPFAAYVKNDLNKFALLNDYLFSNTSLLDKKYQDILFKKDVKMYYNYFDDPVDNFATTDIFQASNMITQISLKLITEGADSPQAVEHAKFLFRNSLNDLYMKNSIISNMMLESLDRQNQTIEKGILQNLIVLLCLLIVFFAYILILIIKQYQKQIVRLSAFCRIPNNKLDRVLHNFHDFKHNLASDSPMQTSFFKKRLVSSNVHIALEDSKKDLSKTPIYSQQRRKIYIPIISLTILSLSFAIIIISASVLYLDFLTSLQGKQDLIYFADAIAAKLTLGWSAGRELLVTNNTALVENKNVGEKFEEILNDISNIRAKAYDVLLQDNHEVSDNEIKGLIIGDACSLLTPNFAGFCKFLRSLGQTPNLIENLNNLESLLRARLQKYESSDKSLEALKTIEIEDFYFIHNNFILLRGVSAQISALLNENYEEEILKTNDKGDAALGIFIFCAIVAGLCFWRYVYIRLRDEVSQFKNILRVLPGDVVLSNFILKAFLMKTSNRVLETIKNDI